MARVTVALYLLFLTLVYFLSPVDFCASDPEPPSWTPVRPVSLGFASSSHPSIQAYKNQVYTVWSDNRLRKSDIFFRYSLNDGLSWSEEEIASETEGESLEPEISFDGKFLHLTWREKREKLSGEKLSEISEIRYKRWDGKSWGYERTLSIQPTPPILLESFKNPTIVSTKSESDPIIYAAWEAEWETESETLSPQSKSTRSKRTKIYITHSSDRGQSWSEPKILLKGDWNTKEPTLSSSFRDAYILWRDEREGFAEIFFKRVTLLDLNASNLNLNLGVRLSNTKDCKRPTISVSEPFIQAAWESSKTSKTSRSDPEFNSEIFTAQSNDNGLNWTVAQPLSQTSQTSQTQSEQASPFLIAADKETWLFWQDGRDENWEIYTAAKANSQLEWSSPLRLTKSESASISPKSNFSSNQIHLVWEEQFRTPVDLKSNLLYMKYDPTPPIRPGKPIHLDFTSKLGYDDDKTLDYTWENSSIDVVKYEIFASTDGGEFLNVGASRRNRFQLKGETGKKYKLFVKAVDEVGNRSENSITSDEVEVDTEPPKASIDLPKNNSLLINSTYITISCLDPNLSKCALEYGASASPNSWKFMQEAKGELKNSRLTFWDISGLNLPNGLYTLRLTASDKANNRTEVRAKVIIDRSPPIKRVVNEIKELISSDFGFSYFSPTWSNDGLKIAYASNEGGSFDIWSIKANGKEADRLTHDPKVETNPSFSPKADKVAFQTLASDNWDLWLVDSNGKNPKPLLSTIASEKEPFWSPSGEEIAFISNADGDDEVWLLLNVSEVISSGKEPNLLQLTHNRWNDSKPAWSPDGIKVAFQSNRAGDWDIFQIDVDGTNEKELIKTSFDDTSPKFSSDGKQLLFISNRQILTLNFISNAIFPWLDLSTEIQSVDWSPNNDQFVYETQNSLNIANLSSSSEKLIAKITSPKKGDLVSGKLDIFGIASGSNFKGYKIEYSSDANAINAININWTQLETLATSEVAQIGFLASWNTQFLSGKFRIRLSVVDTTGQTSHDEVEIYLTNYQPQLLISEPKDGILTDKEEIQIRGSVEIGAVLRINGIILFLSLNGKSGNDGKAEFSTPFLLKEGLNEIAIEAEGSLGQKTSLLRKVILDTKAPEISVDSPTDFQMVSVPYILISGKIDEEASLKVSGVELFPDENGKFSRRIGLSEGINSVLIQASDRLGHTASIMRRAIYRQEQRGRKDIQSPAIVDVFPPERAVIQNQNPQISARLVDDIEIDPDSIKIILDGKEVQKGTALFDPNSGVLKYEPSQPLLDGVHVFTIEVQDASQNRSEPLKSSFVVDSQPTLVKLSAELLDLEDMPSVRITLTSNKKIVSIPIASLISRNAKIGYSIQFALVKANKEKSVPEHYESLFPLTHLIDSFIIEAITIDISGNQTHSFGAFAWKEFQEISRARLELPNGATVEFEPVSLSFSLKSKSILKSKPNRIAIFRSQDGLDPELINLQRQDEKMRELTPSGLVYQVQLLGAEKESQGNKGNAEFTINLPRSEAKNMALFYWNDRFQRWTAAEGETLEGGEQKDEGGGRRAEGDRQKAEGGGRKDEGEMGAVRAKVYKQGFYALLVDEQPPTIKNISPKDGKEVPLDKFLIEAKISDQGSGIDRIEFSVDGDAVDFIYDYNSEDGQLSYLPSDLDLGLHLLEIKAIDRAGNSAQTSSRFFTQDIFDFADKVFSFPNPTSQSCVIIFKLTKSAEVKLKIYDISSQLIYSAQLENSVGYGGGSKGEKFVWNGENRYGLKVSSGIYIYIIEANRDGGKITRSGKIAVVR